MDSRARRRGANTVTVQPNTNPPPHIPRAALILSLLAAIIAIISQFTRSPIPHQFIPDQPPTTNITSLSDLVRAVFDAPQRGHFFRSGCLSRRSLLCHSLQHVSHVLDDVDVSDDGDSYVFRISKHDVSNMRKHVLLRRERMDGCTPWHHGTFFMKLDWLLLYYLPRSIATKFFATGFTQAGFRRDRWGWCAGTTPFADHLRKPTPPKENPSSEAQASSPHPAVFQTTAEPSSRDTSNNAPNKQAADTFFRDTSNPPQKPEQLHRPDPVNREPQPRRNVMYAR